MNDRTGCANDDGAILIIAIVVVTAVALVVGAVLTRGDGSLRATVALRQVAGTTYAADGAAQVAINDLRTGYNTGRRRARRLGVRTTPSARDASATTATAAPSTGSRCRTCTRPRSRAGRAVRRRPTSRAPRRTPPAHRAPRCRSRTRTSQATRSSPWAPEARTDSRSRRTARRRVPRPGRCLVELQHRPRQQRHPRVDREHQGAQRMLPGLCDERTRRRLRGGDRGGPQLPQRPRHRRHRDPGPADPTGELLGHR